MTDYSVTTAKHQTLAAATVDRVTLASASAIEILNRSTTSTDLIYARNDGTDPTVGGDNSFVIMAGTSIVLPRAAASLTVRLISATTPAYSVTAIA